MTARASRGGGTHALPDVAGTIGRALASAGLGPDGAPMQGITGTIRNALEAAAAHLPDALRVASPPESAARLRPVSKRRPAADAEPALPGSFVTRSYTGAAGSRTYKLYTPSTYSATGDGTFPLVVMLHGCTQSPDDFAAGTRMNALAEQHGALVAYPAQSPNANGSRCWNWFRPEDQQRDRGEPAIIAGIVHEIAAQHRVDRERVYVAGLSAGAAMAVILGETYPDVFAAIGAHSGLPYGAAHDMPSAFGAMKGAAPAGRPVSRSRVPTIVFHGDHDQTVDARNGAAIAERAAAGYTREPGLRSSVQTGTAESGSRFRRTTHADTGGRIVIEDWVVHGGGHAWSGGSPAGSFTDARGPDASAEMLRFFLSHRAARVV